MSHDRYQLPPDELSREQEDATCPRCGAAFASQADLEGHIQSHVVNSPTADCVCTECGAAFDTRGELEEHAAVHQETAKAA